MDSVIEKEDIALLKPIGMTCPYNTNFQCGTFDNWDDYMAQEKENHCRGFCIGKTGKPGHNKKADRVNEGLAHETAHWGHPAYELALANSVTNGLISKKKLTEYQQVKARKRTDGWDELKKIRRI